MVLIKNDIPILEYDSNQQAVIEPTHEGFSVKLPRKCVFAFLGEVVDTYALEHDAKVVLTFDSMTKKYPVYVISYNGEDICLCQAPVGSSAAVQLMDWLIGYGVSTIISTGSCGALIDLPENVLLVPTKALRDEGASYHYLAPSRFVETNPLILNKIEEVMTSMNIPYQECITWSTDGFYRETKEKVEYRKSEGCSVVEMECASLLACAKFRGVSFGQILYTADSLANIDVYTQRGWGRNSIDKALLVSLEIISKM